ncbi:DUF6205 family protein [Streptomyces werraensis]|uniref:DUF6205 family protein n=1 Tax=Streptomyces werraensis TaxID=68284 RepID=UPI00381DE880
MGYNTSVTGEIRIEPPLSWREFKDSPFTGQDMDVKLRIDAETVDTDDGPLMRKTASAIVPAWEDSYKAYKLIEHVQQVIDAFPGHTFTGRLECEGEENTDIWRVIVRDGRALRIEPRIVWPDEDGAQ